MRMGSKIRKVGDRLQRQHNKEQKKKKKKRQRSTNPKKREHEDACGSLPAKSSTKIVHSFNTEFAGLRAYSTPFVKGLDFAG